MVDWITRHAVSLLNKFHVGVDGRTAHYRIHHKNFNGKVFEIGEQVLAKPKRKTRSRSGNSTRARWLKGTWVGWDERTGEHVVVLHTGQAVRIRSVRPVPESERWSAEAVRAMRATPHAPNPKDIDRRDPLPARDAKRKDDAARGQDLPEPEVRDGEHRDFRITENCCKNMDTQKAVQDVTTNELDWITGSTPLSAAKDWKRQSSLKSITRT